VVFQNGSSTVSLGTGSGFAMLVMVALVQVDPAASAAGPVTQTFDVRPIARTPADVRALAELVRACVRPETWSHVGGDGDLVATPNGGIQVTNDAEIVGHVEGLLGAMGAPPRPLMGRRGAPRGNGRPAAGQKAEELAAADRPAPVAAFGPAGDPGRLLLVVYDVKDLAGQGVVQRIAARIGAEIAPETWDVAGGEGVLVLYAPTHQFVILQTAAAHDAVARLLGQLRGNPRAAPN
jgi:hypothetical protein